MFDLNQCIYELKQMLTDMDGCGGQPERSAVVMNGFLVAAAVLQEVGVVVVNFGIVRQRLDTRAKIGKDKNSVIHFLRREKKDTEIKSQNSSVVPPNHESSLTTYSMNKSNGLIN